MNKTQYLCSNCVAANSACLCGRIILIYRSEARFKNGEEAIPRFRQCCARVFFVQICVAADAGVAAAISRCSTSARRRNDGSTRSHLCCRGKLNWGPAESMDPRSCVGIDAHPSSASWLRWKATTPRSDGHRNAKDVADFSSYLCAVQLLPTRTGPSSRTTSIARRAFRPSGCATLGSSTKSRPQDGPTLQETSIQETP